MKVKNIEKKIQKKFTGKSNIEIMRKILFSCLIISVVAIFSVPGFIFADEGDVEKFVGVRERDGVAGQYIAGDNEDTRKDSEGDGDTEIFCIDYQHHVNINEKPYDKTGDSISEEMINDGDTEVDAYAMEILAKEATGATSVEDQCAAWQLTDDTYGIKPDTNTNKETDKDKEDIDAIVDATRELAEEYIKPEGAKEQGKTLDEFLDKDKDVNEIDVTIEQDETVFEEGGSGTATATMAEPLVPGITDEGKDVYWSILEGAFNISFSSSELVLETFSNDIKTDADRMQDYTDDANDNDGDEAAGSTDHYGKSTVSYYYYMWTDKDGNALFPENAMGVGLFAWVDVDDDGKYDIVDIGYEEDTGEEVEEQNKDTKPDGNVEEEGEDTTTDGDVVGELQEKYKVVQLETDGGGKEVIKTDEEGQVVSEPMSTKDMDIHTVEGGQVLKKVKTQNGQTYFDDNRQTLATLSYTEPIDDDPQFFGTILFKYTGDSIPLGGAKFGLYSSSEASGDPEMILTTNDNGFAATGNAGIEYGEWYLKEIEPPAGYNKNSTVYQLKIGGSGVYAGVVDTDELSILPFSVKNSKTPPPDEPEEPDAPETPDTATGIEVKGLESVTVLAFTGFHPVFPIAGVGTILSGLGLFITSILRRKNR